MTRERAPVTRPMCQHCRLKPITRKRAAYCSKACSNSSRQVPLADRFLIYYHPGKPDACWPWTGTIDRNGYGVISDEKRRQIRAHRIAYERVKGRIPDGLCVLHHCDNRPCCNPDHLFVGTDADNNHDRHRKGRYPTGAAHPLAKLTDQDVREIRSSYPQMTQKSIAERYGLDQTTISEIVLRKKWKHV